MIFRSDDTERNNQVRTCRSIGENHVVDVVNAKVERVGNVDSVNHAQRNVVPEASHVHAFVSMCRVATCLTTSLDMKCHDAQAPSVTDKHHTIHVTPSIGTTLSSTIIQRTPPTSHCKPQIRRSDTYFKFAISVAVSDARSLSRRHEPPQPSVNEILILTRLAVATVGAGVVVPETGALVGALPPRPGNVGATVVGATVVGATVVG